ncbi:glycoside hydrolase family 27 protein [Catelliglobosispora koreensis]|uniref:glycoside hydrolase family 27 protein n=1 Tax=Catelliglobosispora koreensis TaxID=129052 RepID=UPI0003624510|nr:glycoside hydrolase family 27 protein [Catelliglobosispora koreensis]
MDPSKLLVYGSHRRVIAFLTAAVAVSALAITITAQSATALSRTVPADTVNIDHSYAKTPRMILRSESWTRTTAASMKKTADDAVATGLATLGWNTVSFDDTWAVRSDCTDWDTAATVVPNCSNGRNTTTGNLIPSPAKYPNGLKDVGDYLHSKGLFFGVYASGGKYMCDYGSSGHPAAPGSFDHFETDFRFFASVGADYIKLDYCGEPNTTNKCCFTVLDSDLEINTAIESSRRAANAINAIKADPDPSKRRAMVLNISAPAYANWDNDNFPTPLFQRMMNSIVPAGHAYRVGGDVGGTSWGLTTTLVDMIEGLRPFGKQGHFLDPDRLYFDDTVLTTDNKLGGYVMWAMQNSHMVAMIRNSNASGAISSAQASLMNKPGIIAVGQDALAATAKRVARGTGYDVFAKPLSNGDYAVAIMNRSNTSAVTATTSGTVIGTTARTFSLTAINGPAVSPDANGNFSVTVPAGTAVMYRLKPASASFHTAWTFGANGSTSRNSTAITDGDAPTAGSLDASGRTLSSDRLANNTQLPNGSALSVRAGQTVTIGGVAYVWPNTTSGQFDSIKPTGQTIDSQFSGTQVNFLGTSGIGESGGTIRLNYSDGTSSTAAWGFPSWSCAPATAYPATVAFRVFGRNDTNGLTDTSTGFCVYTRSVPITAGKTLRSITLPDAPNARIFAVKAS